jgi:phage terminase small subunit
MARPRKSIELHRLSGSKPRWQEQQDTTPPPRAMRLKMPKDLPPDGQAEWKRMSKYLSRRGTTSAETVGSRLDVYCRLWARWKKVEAEAFENPTVTSTWLDAAGVEHSKIVESPQSKIAARLENSIRAYQRDFSATPASREATTPTPQPQPKGPAEGTAGWFELHRDEIETLRVAEYGQPEPQTAAFVASEDDMNFEA